MSRDRKILEANNQNHCRLKLEENQAKEIEILKNTIELEEKILKMPQQLDISLSDPEKDETKKIEAEIKDLQSEIDQITKDVETWLKI